MSVDRIPHNMEDSKENETNSMNEDITSL